MERNVTLFTSATPLAMTPFKPARGKAKVAAALKALTKHAVSISRTHSATRDGAKFTDTRIRSTQQTEPR